MKVITNFLILTGCFITYSCDISPQSIDFGNDGCRYCNMTIVDKVYAAQIVTNKGKVYNFDASECMIHMLKEIDSSEVALYLSTDYATPGKLIDATTATFLISENLPSPMGAYLSSFEMEAAAASVKKAKGGQMYNWDQICNHLNQQPNDSK